MSLRSFHWLPDSIATLFHWLPLYSDIISLVATLQRQYFIGKQIDWVVASHLLFARRQASWTQLTPPNPSMATQAHQKPALHHYFHPHNVRCDFFVPTPRYLLSSKPQHLPWRTLKQTPAHDNGALPLWLSQLRPVEAFEIEDFVYALLSLLNLLCVSRLISPAGRDWCSHQRSSGALSRASLCGTTTRWRPFGATMSWAAT